MEGIPIGKQKHTKKRKEQKRTPFDIQYIDIQRVGGMGAIAANCFTVISRDPPNCVSFVSGVS